MTRILVLLSLTLVAGCIYAPPPPPPPPPHHVHWRPAHWYWNGAAWVWVPGHEERR